MKLHFRKAKNEDLPFLLNLEKDAFPEFQQNSKQNLKNGIKSSFQEVLIVESETTPTSKLCIGAIVLFKYKKSLRIYSVALITEFRNQGLGAQIISYVHSFAEQNQLRQLILEVDAENAKLIDWYKSKGFVVSEELLDYYAPNKHALKMVLPVDTQAHWKRSKNVIVIDQPFKWEQPDINANIISVKEYINNVEYQNNAGFRIFNLCSSYKYQSYGYYVSLLASARGQRIIPSITTIRDFGIINVIQSVAYELNDLIDKLLAKVSGKVFSLDVYFGQTPDKTYKTLASKLYQIFEAPLFRVHFIKDEKWIIKSIKVRTFNTIGTEEQSLMYQFALNYFNKKRHNYPKLTNYTYDIAVLVNPNEENPPSNNEALEKLRIAANKKGVYLEFITKKDRDKINEFDALFIRETTNVNHYTYEFSRLAFAEGLVVIDDPWSILRCSNKIYQHELFKKNKIRTPNSVVFTRNIFNKKQLDNFTYPVVLKQPDSAFSLGVIKVNDKEEALLELNKLFKKTDMVICQEFMYSEFDWRIGILDNKPLFACKYFMSKNHWQIYHWDEVGDEQVGAHETVSISDVPVEVLNVALKAAALIGDGLYGVDLKYVDGHIYVIEVNDNPNIDVGVEDMVLKDELYDTLIDSLIHRIEIAKNIRKINLTKNSQYNVH